VLVAACREQYVSVRACLPILRGESTNILNDLDSCVFVCTDQGEGHPFTVQK